MIRPTIVRAALSFHSHLLKSKEFWAGILYCSLAVILVNSSASVPAIHMSQESLAENIVPDNGQNVPVEQTESTRNGKVLCWIVTTPKNVFKAERVQKTWGKRCDKLLFMSSKNDTSFPAIGLPIVEESRLQLWNKAKLTLRYIYKNHLQEYDWFLKADDDTYVIMENLRHYLSTMNSSLPLFLGRKFKAPENNITFLAGGSGYVLTRESLKRLVEQGLDQKKCKEILAGSLDDLIISDCLKDLGAIFADTRDQWGLQRFIPFNPENLYNINGLNMMTIRKYDTYPVGKGYKCCSNQAISFHYVSGYKMQLLEYLIYKLQVMNTSKVVSLS